MVLYLWAISCQQIFSNLFPPKNYCSIMKSMTNSSSMMSWTKQKTGSYRVRKGKRMFYVIFDFIMAVIMFLFGTWFYKSDGKAANFLSGYNMKPENERKKYDEKTMCKAYGYRMIVMSLPFVLGIMIDIQYQGIGCLIAWFVWFVMFILLLVDRSKRER